MEAREQDRFPRPTVSRSAWATASSDTSSKTNIALRPSLALRSTAVRCGVVLSSATEIPRAIPSPSSISEMLELRSIQ